MRGAAGFTLVEMMVALALVALMSVGMLQAYRFSQRALVQTTRLEAAARDVAATQRLLRRILEQAYPFEAEGSNGGAVGTLPVPLIGDSKTFAVSAPASAHLGGSGLYRYEIGLDDAHTLQAAWRLDRNGGVASTENHSREALLEDVSEISIAYLELIGRSDGSIETHWRDSWAEKNRLPALVRIRLKFPPNDRRRWPEFVVAPRLNADANCVFDVVSQMCRIAS